MDLGIGAKRAAVAAASKGLGFGVASALAAEGVQVAICGRHRDSIEDAGHLWTVLTIQGWRIAQLEIIPLTPDDARSD